MSNYFSKFPVIQYQKDKNTSLYLSNIMVRFSFEEKFKNNTSTYFKYTIKENETPELLAHKLYGDPEKHWIIFLMNNIVDPFYDWPLSYREFNEYIISNYDSIENSTSTIHSYYKVISFEYSNGNYLKEYYQIPEKTYDELPSNDYKLYTLPDSTEVIVNTTKITRSYYEYERIKNERKKQIKILKPEFINSVVTELEELLET